MTFEPELDVGDIQGHSLRGFGTDALALVGLKIGEPSLARAWLSALSGRVDTLAAVHHYRLTRSFAPMRLPRTLLNIALSAHGLTQMAIDISTVEDGMFRQPMGFNAGTLGDPTDSAQLPTDYVLGKTWEDTPDILLIIGGDTAEAALKFAMSLRSAASMAGCSTMYEELGQNLPGEVEHFGFRDGISQVGVRGRLSSVADDFLTLRRLAPTDPLAKVLAKPGQPLVWPGQFVFGYPTHQPGSPLDPGPNSDGGAPWMKNGSYLVFRRLRQDIPAFRQFLQAQAGALSAQLHRPITAEEAGALIVGRWPDGSPVSLAPFRPNASISDDEMMVNNFAYAQGTPAMTVSDSIGEERDLAAQQDDALGQRCPFFAHVRKVNPRDLATDQGIAGRTLTFQMLRRGIPYGQPFSGPDPDGEDRGLLFLAYQTSFKRQFNVLNSLWVNNPSAPEMSDEGHDILVSQNSGKDRFATLRDPTGTVMATIQAQERWVIPTGGGFFFTPSISFLKSLS
ncbi:MAG: Dyp-type peroxidase [Thiobacillus sp.]